MLNTVLQKGLHAAGIGEAMPLSRAGIFHTHAPDSRLIRGCRPLLPYHNNIDKTLRCFAHAPPFARDKGLYT